MQSLIILSKGHITLTPGSSLQESVLGWAKRCNLGVCGASALKSITKCVCSHMKHRDEVFSNAEHEAEQTMPLHF